MSTPGLLLREPPAADPAVLATIAAAVELTWPQPGPAAGHHEPQDSWRFSGRWWHKPATLRRDRPWTRR